MLKLINVTLLVVMLVPLPACVSTLRPVAAGKVQLIKGADIPSEDQVGLLNRKSDEDWIVITFSSSDDYASIAKRKQLRVFVAEMLCTNGVVQRDIMNSELIPALPTDVDTESHAETATPSRQMFHYRTYFRVRSAASAGQAPNDPRALGGYDLNTDTRDLCIRVKGGNMLNMGISSGMAVFPRTDVSAALNMGGRQPGL